MTKADVVLVLSMNKQTSILLVRHGQSTWNKVHRWQGQADPPLTDEGRNQARVAAKSVGSVDAIVSSPLQRSLETALIISEIVGIGPVNTIEDLQERDSGDWSGKTRDEIYSQWADWEETGYRPNGWEPDDEFLERIYRGFAQIEKEFAGGTVLLVSHSGVIITLERDLGAPQGRISNLAGQLLTVSGDVVTCKERISLIPDDISTGGESKDNKPEPL